MLAGVYIKNEKVLEPRNVHIVELVYAMEKIHKIYKTDLTETSELVNL